MSYTLEDIRYGSKWLLQYRIDRFIDGQVLIHSCDIPKGKSTNYSVLMCLDHVRGRIDDIVIEHDRLILRLDPVARRVRYHYEEDASLPCEWIFSPDWCRWATETDSSSKDMLFLSEGNEWHLCFVSPGQHDQIAKLSCIKKS